MALHPIFADIVDSFHQAAALDRIANRLIARQPVYWPENFDSKGRHIITYHKKDWDTCDDCGMYGAVAYWFGGPAVTPEGKIDQREQVPLCALCSRELHR